MWRSIPVALVLVLAVVLQAHVASAQTLYPGGLTQLPSDNPTANLVTNGGFESVSGGQPTSWTTGAGWSADSTVTHSGTSSYKWTGGPSTQQAISVKAGVYNLSAWLKLSGVSGPNGAGVGLILDLRPTINVWYPIDPRLNGTADWALHEIKSVVVPQDMTINVVLENFAGASGTAWFDDVQLVRMLPQPVEAFMLYPNYRGMLFDDQSQTMRFDVKVAPPDDSDPSLYTVTATLSQEGGGTVLTQTYPGQAHFVAQLDGSAMQPGSAYRVTFSINTTPAYSYPDYRVSKVAATTRASMNVAFDEKNRVLLHNEPRFILGVYDSDIGYTTDDAGWEQILWSSTGDRRMTGLPINMYLNYMFPDAGATAMDALMANLQKHGVMYLQTGNCALSGDHITMGVDNALPGDPGPFYIDRTDSYVQDLGSQPGSAGYYTADECIAALASSTFDQYVRLRNLDPDSMTFGALLGDLTLPAWRDALDLLGTDPYPLFGAEGSGYHHSEVADWTAAARNAVMDARPIVTVLQFFQATDNARWPTLQEMRNHAYMAIVEGARGLFWWSLGLRALQDLCPDWSCPERTAHMNDLKSVVNEVSNLEDVLLQDDEPGALITSSNSAIRTKVKLFGGQGYLLAYNYQGTSQSATFTWNTAPGTITVNGELVNGSPRQVTPSGDTFSDTFGPYQAHVYIIQHGGTGGTPQPLRLNFTNPQDGATVSGTVTVSVAASGGSGTGYTYTISENGTPFPGTSSSVSWNTNSGQYPDGAYTLTATVTDSNGTHASATPISVTVHQRAPLTVSITSPAPNAIVSGTVTVQMSVSGASGTSNRFALSANNIAVCTTTVSGTTASCSWNTAGLAPSQALQVTVTDAMGATGSASENVTVNNAGAMVSFTSPANGATVSGTITVGMSVSGASGNSNTFKLSIDGTLVSTQTVAATTASYSWTTVNYLTGPHTLTLTVTDAANNSGTATVNVNVSNPFQVFITSPTGGTVSGTNWVTVWWQGARTAAPNYTVTVAGQTVATAAASAPQPTSIPWNTASVADGAQTIIVTGVDGAGQQATAQVNVTVTNGVAGMSAAITSPTSGTVSGTTTVSMSVTNATGASNTFKLFIDGSLVATQTVTITTASYSWSTVGYLNGSHSLAVTVTDAAGHTVASPTVTVTVSNTYAIFITAPTAGTIVSGTNWLIVWWQGASTSAPAYSVSVGGLVVATAPSAAPQPTAIAWDTTRVSDGAQTVTVTGTDGANHVTTATVSVTVSNMTAAVTSPAPGATVSGTVTVGMSVTGASGTSNTFKLYVDGGLNSTQTVATTTASSAWTTNNILSGSHSLVVVVTDATGRTVSSPAVTVTVSNTFAVFITSPNSGDTVSGTNWVIVWWEGAQTAAPNYVVKVDGQQVATSPAAAPQPTSIPWNTTAVGNGPHTLTVTGTDGAGHVSSPSVSITVSN
jgi:Bacterial Ig domain